MKLEYSVRIDRLSENDGGGYLATVAELPGCMADGETPELALKNVQDAIVSWIEAAKAWKQHVPEPTVPSALAAARRLARLGGSTPDIEAPPRRRPPGFINN
ncbi:type II toxin-antitoxin system HicB family antitoxin [Rhodopseudomonas palustris]|uniref:type II toxin-antitoxin system HicB family antitoxin n=1 Tax=Rhodopseudomonas palustris TaxID=1076 RepID=UPI0020CDCD25|nr:type II toxin-antitoxin system HicB family antitoxin [Rhodopseudomonas palustris]MCP9629334.1 type II toxin-antitoxin system HicB family antitoxin [Rhodopseudomonas palustris]